MLLLTALLALAAGDSAPIIPAALAPKGVAAAAIYVSDLDAEKAWYVEKLGLTVQGSVPPNVPKPFEWVLGYGKTQGDGAAILLAKSTKRPPGENLYSRSIILVPDAKGLAAWLKTHGVESREAVPGVAYMIQDPEKNTIELFSPKP